MNADKVVVYPAKNRYFTQNELTDKTQYIWLVFHGMGYLSRYFLNYFKDLDPDLHYIIAPQAPSRYYQDTRYKRIGASWLTREDTELEIENVLAYIDAVWTAEGSSDRKLILMGYSQGVSIATRWLAHSRVICHQLILHSGGLPKELKRDQFDFLPQNTRVDFVYGTADPYINEERKVLETSKAQELFEGRLGVHSFEGGHEVSTSFINNSYKK